MTLAASKRAFMINSCVILGVHYDSGRSVEGGGSLRPRPRAQTVARENGFRSLAEAYQHIDHQYARVGKMSAGEAVDLLRALAVGADAVRELARLARHKWEG